VPASGRYGLDCLRRTASAFNCGCRVFGIGRLPSSLASPLQPWRNGWFRRWIGYAGNRYDGASVTGRVGAPSGRGNVDVRDAEGCGASAFLLVVPSRVRPPQVAHCAVILDAYTTTFAPSLPLPPCLGPGLERAMRATSLPFWQRVSSLGPSLCRRQLPLRLGF
jgi:hypothetical protein